MIYLTKECLSSIGEYTLKKRESDRSRAKNPALNPQYNPRKNREYVDYDYTEQLSDEEKAWLNDFTEEYYNAAVKGKDKITGENIVHTNRFHNTDRLKKSVTDAKNARERCEYSRAFAQGILINAPLPENYEINPDAIESNLIDIIEYEEEPTE